MTLKDYQKLALRTMANLGDIRLDLSHMVMGLGTELSELIESKTMVNRLEEVGDQFWYLSGYCSVRGLSLEYIAIVSNNMEHINADINIDLDAIEIPTTDVYQLKVYLNLVSNISKLQDIVKKHIAYGKVINESEELLLLARIYDCLLLYGFIMADEVLADLLQRNIDKLRVRYPEKFQEYLAINRNLDEEYKALGSDYDYDKTTAYYNK